MIDFAGLREFEELKLKNYSSGMHVRLAFSVMIQVDADVLMIDEVLAVGDAAFQQKCFDVFNKLRDEGRTILFVTHDMSSVRRFCHRAMLVDRGKVRMVGDPVKVGGAYMDLNFDSDTGEAVKEGERMGDSSAELLEAWWEDETGERQTTLHQGRACSFRARVRFDRPVEDPRIAVGFENEQGLPLLATSTQWAEDHTGTFAAGEEVVFTVTLDMAFAPGRIYASPWVDDGDGGRVMDRRPRMSTALVKGPYQTGGLVDLPHDVRLEAPSRVLAGPAMRS